MVERNVGSRRSSETDNAKVQTIEKLLMANDSDLEQYCTGTCLSELEELFNQMWNQVRQANLYGGQPRSASSMESLSVARLALSLAKQVTYPRLLAEAWCMMAYALNANEDYVESLIYYRQAIEALEQLGDLKRAARIRLGFMTALSATGQSREALAVGLEADKLFREQSDPASLAKLATNFGAVYGRLDDHERACKYHREAADLFKQLGDERAMAQVYLNLGNKYCFLDRFAESEQMYANCESIAVRLGLRDLREQSLYNKAYLYFYSGRLSQAIAHYRDARALYQASGSQRHAALCDLDEAEIYVQLRLPNDALLLARSAADSFAKLNMPYEQGKAIVFGAVALTQKRLFGDALAAFRQAQILFERDGNAFWNALLDLYRAEVLFSVRRLWEAHSLASDADSKFVELGSAEKRLVSLVLLGRVSLELGKLTDAEFYARTVQELAEQAKTRLFLFACYALSAEIAEREGHLDSAKDFYERAALEIERRHTHLHHDELGITFFKGKTEVFESLATLTLTLNKPQAFAVAYSWCEKAKAQMVVDALAPHLPSVRSHASEALLARVERIRAELNGSYLRMRPEFLNAPGLPQGSQVEMKEDELVRTLGELSKTDSEYVSLQRASSVPLNELQASLPNDTTLIEYFFAREEVFTFVATKNKFEAIRHITPTKRVQYLVGRLQHQLKRFASVLGHSTQTDNATLERSTEDLMHEFYKELVEPVIPFIDTASLIIVPQGVLHRLPFHAFHDGESYIADLFDVSYAPSGSVLNYCLGRSPVTGATPLLISTGSVSSSILRSAATRRLLGTDAVREMVVRESAKAEFIHLEVPVAFRQDNPVLSGFELTDGMFCIPDIYSTKWETNILSLCLREPSLDVTGNGDDLLSLLRSFLYAGSRSVLIELWKLRREPADFFFDKFYSERMAGKSTRVAMRAALKTVRSDYEHPFYWAPFVLQGHPSARSTRTIG